ncbi:MAG: MFS transporter [Pseudomonadota bacterium]
MELRRADWRQGWVLVFAGFLPVMAIIALAPTLPTLIAHFKDVPYARLMVPLLLTVPSACIALLAPVAGVITDYFGRRNLMLGAMFLYGAGGIVPFIIDHFWAVVAGRILIGIAEAGILTVANTLLADYYDGETRRRWLMIQGLAGSVLGSVLLGAAGYLAAIGWQWPFAVYAIAFPVFVGAYFFLYEPAPRSAAETPQAAKSGVPDGGPFPLATMLAVCGVTLLISTVYFVQPIHFSLLLKEMGVSNPRSIGLISAVPSLGVPLGSILFKLSGRIGSPNQLVLVMLCYAAGLGGIGMSTTPEQAMAFAFVQQIGSGIAVPGLIAWAQNQLGFEHRGRGMGMWASAFFAAQFVSPAVVAAVIAMTGGLHGAFTAFAGLAAACAVAALLRRQLQGPKKIGLVA